MRTVVCSLMMLLLTSCSQATARWWPVQKTPVGIVRTVPHETFEAATSPNGRTTEGSFGATCIMVQSLAGLAARAVNEGCSDEMIWIEVGGGGHKNPDYELYYKQLKARVGFEDLGQFGSWELAERCIQRGIVKGYVLYRYDYSSGNPYEKRKDADHSVNAATMAAAAESGILIEEGLEEKAKSLGLKLLYDARDKTTREVFNQYKNQLTRNLYTTIDPKVGHCRDFAIAYRCAVGVGMEGSASEILEWLEPLSPIIGYPWEDEFKETAFYSRWGHYVTATNWSLNMCAMLSAQRPRPNVKVKSVDPKKIDFQATPYACSFVLSDGDNMCWLTGDFVHNSSYWDNPLRKEIPFNWTSCFVNLAQAAPVTTEALIDSQTPNSGFIEYGGGYQYPDLFAVNRPNRKELLRKFAHRTWQWMDMMDIKVFGFITEKFDTPNAIEAYEIYAQEMSGLTGMIAVEYAPYEGGPGRVIWVKNKQGIEIPVVQANFSIWANHNSPHGGTPAKVARRINEEAQKARTSGLTSYNWVIVHAWSGFKQSQTNDENAENGKFREPGTQAGLPPAAWTIQRLNQDVKPVTIDELLWLIRMEHNPEQTKTVIQNLGKGQK